MSSKACSHRLAAGCVTVALAAKLNKAEKADLAAITIHLTLAATRRIVRVEPDEARLVRLMRHDSDYNLRAPLRGVCPATSILSTQMHEHDPGQRSEDWHQRPMRVFYSHQPG
mmetsp:Transcript_13398/g.40613  ORF Transcript_13398/g.40613 Transcript_13398/m.40613 type:complete len:113 (-) Transcript_13398:1558-1896(-)|eukprot:scaffold42264_cov33-Tisochrysis_lutea.AAC.2